MKKIWAVRKDSEGVSPVIATILMVAITVVLAAVLYVMVLGFGTDTSSTPTTSLTKSSITSGVKLSFSAVNEDVEWGDLSFLLSDGSNNGNWANLTTDDLNDVLGDLKNLGAATVGSLSVTMKVTDISGNGKADQGDYIELTATSFGSATDYTFTVIYEPTDGEMAKTTFSG